MSRKVETTLPTLAKMKIMILGDCGVGKSCLLNKFIKPSGKVPTTNPGTIGIDYASKRMDVQTVPTYVHFWDLSGDEIYLEVRNEFYPEANGIILCYDCSNKESFDHLQNWIDEGSKYNAGWANAILVGCKSDAGNSVPKEAANAFAKKLGITSYQVSAKSGQGVDGAFNELLKAVQKKLG
jgi:small GTP-binding protein